MKKPNTKISTLNNLLARFSVIITNWITNALIIQQIFIELMLLTTLLGTWTKRKTNINLIKLHQRKKMKKYWRVKC